MKLKGKVVLITGSAQGIGKAIAEALAKEGADIVVSDINIDLAKQTANEIGKSGVKTTAVKLDVSNAGEVNTAVAEIVKTMGGIDILVNNAGITKDGLLMRMKEEDWNAVININLSSMFHTTKAIVPLMMKKRWGRIVNIASIVGEMGNAGQANYAAAKAGAIGLTKTVARETATRGITCNAIAPGFIDTAMTKKLSDDIKKKLSEQIPMNKLGTPEDVAKAVTFLCANADYITGQVVSVNGGMYM
ncbi:3-oxoacyl-[acyl-carrier-protein] reductase [Candidatus Margulisiibacteriota bacterium]